MDLLNFMVQIQGTRIDLRLSAEREYSFNQVGSISSCLMYFLKVRIRRVLFILPNKKQLGKTQDYGE